MYIVSTLTPMPCFSNHSSVVIIVYGRLKGFGVFCGLSQPLPYFILKNRCSTQQKQNTSAS